MYDSLESARDICLLGNHIRRRHVLPGSVAPPCAAPTRLARDMFGFWIREVLRSKLPAWFPTLKIGSKFEIDPLLD